MAAIKKRQGIVERVNVTQLPQPETFVFEGKPIVSTHRYGIKLEGEDTWFNLGSGDKADLVFKDDDGKWQILGPGSEVLIKYVENEGKNGKTYFNTKKSNVTVIEMVPGEKQQPKVQAAAASSGSGETKGNAGGGNDSAYWARKDAGSAASASVDKALAYLAHNTSGPITYENVLSVARDMQAIVQQLAGEILNPPQKEVAPPPNPKSSPKKTTAKPAPPVEEDEWRDDDIPF